MADTFTAFLNLVKPEIDGSAETWGQKLNANLEAIDTWASGIHDVTESAVGAIDARIDLNFPRGTIIMWYGDINAPPPGWLICDGLNGTPNLRERFVLGTVPGGRPVGDIMGDFHVTTPTGVAGQHAHGYLVSDTYMTEAQMPSHVHVGWTDLQGLHWHSIPGGQFVATTAGGGAGFAGGAGVGLVSNTDTAGGHTHNVAMQAAGGNQPHNHGIPLDGNHTHPLDLWVVQPFLALAFLMRA